MTFFFDYAHARLFAFSCFDAEMMDALDSRSACLSRFPFRGVEIGVLNWLSSRVCPTPIIDQLREVDFFFLSFVLRVSFEKSRRFGWGFGVNRSRQCSCGLVKY